MKKLIAILALATTAAGAAKLCVPAQNSWSSSATTAGYDINGNPSASGIFGGWANGIGCGNTSTKSGALTSYCANVQIAGIAACADSVNPNGERLLHNAGNGSYCHCLRTYPTMQYRYWLANANLTTPETGNYCGDSCANHCAQYFTALLSLY
ncbi:MAG: hypothetical protein LBL46_03570 [Rickettsiales bacterium]|nr:hypothetical protein [Rickettsiales bacterium]